MDFKFKRTQLTDGSHVFDIDLFANGHSNRLVPKNICIFSCTSEKDARLFLAGLEKLIGKHTLESLTEI